MLLMKARICSAHRWQGLIVDVEVGARSPDAALRCRTDTGLDPIPCSPPWQRARLRPDRWSIVAVRVAVKYSDSQSHRQFPFSRQCRCLSRNDDRHAQAPLRRRACVASAVEVGGGWHPPSWLEPAPVSGRCIVCGAARRWIPLASAGIRRRTPLGSVFGR